jgi:hypothetical protein
VRREDIMYQKVMHDSADMARGGGWLQLNMFSWVGLDNLMDTKYGEDRRQKRRSVMAETV